MGHDPHRLPDSLPVPVDDSACDHLVGASVPHLRLPSTDHRERDVSELSTGLALIYVYPRTGVPGVAMPDGWEQIPGARGCTPQSCSYRDEHAAFREFGVEVFGLSTQSTEAQREFADREHIPFPLLSDPEVRVGRALRLPTFRADGPVLYKRVTLMVDAGKIVYVR